MDSLNSKEPEELFYLCDDQGQEMAFHFLDIIVYDE